MHKRTTPKKENRKMLTITMNEAEKLTGRSNGQLRRYVRDGRLERTKGKLIDAPSTARVLIQDLYRCFFGSTRTPLYSEMMTPRMKSLAEEWRAEIEAITGQRDTPPTAEELDEAQAAFAVEIAESFRRRWDALGRGG
jgi:hypothetical protein